MLLDYNCYPASALAVGLIGQIGGGLIHLLLVIALIADCNLLQGRRGL